MNNLILNNATMTLKEITDLLDVRHDKALIKVDRMILESSFGTVSKTDIVYNDKGQTIQTYQLDKRQSIAVASRLNTALLMKVIDRWQELEGSRVPPKPLSRFELAQLNLQLIIDADAAEERAKQAEREAIRKLEQIGNHLAGSTISEIGDCVTFNEAAKIISSNLEIKLSHNKLMSLCRSNGWLMTGERSRSEKNHPTELKVHHMRVLVHQAETDGPMLRTVVIRPSGLVQLAKLVPIWVTETKVKLPPPPPPKTLTLTCDEFTLQDYYDVGWTDSLLVRDGLAKWQLNPTS